MVKLSKDIFFYLVSILKKIACLNFIFNLTHTDIAIYML